VEVAEAKGWTKPVQEGGREKEGCRELLEKRRETNAPIG
jgi:hypothetical protein